MTRWAWSRCYGPVSALVFLAACSAAEQEPIAEPTEEAEEFGNRLGEGNPRIRVEPDGQVLVWASGDLDSADAEWYDFTGAPMPPEDLQYGIGKDRIRAIDDPVFVSPDDERLLGIPASPYRDEPVETASDIMVIGYIMEGEPRAYPTALLDRHEIVNDAFKGKPVSVGW